ncbi:MAG: glycosyltransferase family 2 protein [bacterium]|nr:glycosyltransferase family 2 protein [bacterium]
MQQTNTIQNQLSIELSVVVLGYRGGEALKLFVAQLVESLSKSDINYQLVVVGNYWPNTDDKTPEIVRELAQVNKNIKPVIREKEGSMGWDLRSGLEVADGKYIAFIDGDGQMPAEDVIKVYDKIKDSDLDLVKTCRSVRHDEKWRKFISFFYNLLFKILFPGLNAKDINSKPKIFTHQFYNKMELQSDDWFADAEIMIEARRLKARIGEVPTIFKKNEHRPSFVKFSAIFEFIRNFIIYRIREFKRK